MLCVRCVYVFGCGAEGEGAGGTWSSPPWRRFSLEELVLYPLSLRLLVRCRRSSCNTHAIVLPAPRRAFSNVARALAWAY